MAEPRKRLVKEVIATVRRNVGPVASFKDVIIVPRLPKTRSGKIARNTLAAIAAGQPYTVRNVRRISAGSMCYPPSVCRLPLLILNIENFAAEYLLPAESPEQNCVMAEICSFVSPSVRPWLHVK